MALVNVKVDPSCIEHGELLRYGCALCDRVAVRASLVLSSIERAPDERPVSADEYRRLARMLLVYRADDVAYSVAPRVVRRALVSLQQAARWWAAAEVAQ